MYRYILSGAVSYGHDHYVAYVHRENSWEVHNDMV